MENSPTIKVLIVCSGNRPSQEEVFDFVKHQAFIYEQMEAVKKAGSIEFGLFLVRGKGF